MYVKDILMLRPFRSTNPRVQDELPLGCIAKVNFRFVRCVESLVGDRACLQKICLNIGGFCH